MANTNNRKRRGNWLDNVYYTKIERKLQYCKDNHIPYLALYLNKFEEFNINKVKELIK